jgi:chromosomal replication initiator protein
MIATNIWDEIPARSGQGQSAQLLHWFKPTAFVADDGRTVTVRVPNALFKDWITKHYSGVIADALEEVQRSDAFVNFVASGTAEAEPGPAPGPPPPQPAAEPALDEPLPPIAPTPAAGLNPRYTFDSFIVGSSNQFAPRLPRPRLHPAVQPAVHLRGVGLSRRT